MDEVTRELQLAWGRKAIEVPGEWLDVARLPTQLPALESVLRAMPEESLYVRVTGDHAASPRPTRIRLRDVADLAARITGANGALHLQATQLERYDAGCADALHSFTRRIAQAMPEVAHAGTSSMLGLFLSTPGAIAPFHADDEHNFLFQVTGDKQMHCFDPADTQLFPSEAREALVCDDEHVLDSYDPSIEARAKVFHLVPGLMVYHPPMGPHWVDTGRASYSLSFTVTFVTPTLQRMLLVHKLNRRLRGLGITPTPVGRRPMLDRGKAGAAWILRGVVQRGRRAKA